MQNILLLHSPEPMGARNKTYFQGHTLAGDLLLFYTEDHSLHQQHQILTAAEINNFVYILSRMGLLKRPSVWRTLADWNRVAQRTKAFCSLSHTDQKDPARALCNCRCD